MPTSPPHRLFVLRHAKSDWNKAHLADHDRALAPRGRRAAASVAGHLAGLDLDPGLLVLCSTARRATETLEAIQPSLPGSSAVLVEEDLYGATAPLLLHRIRRVEPDRPDVLVVGHNPGLEDLVRSLGRHGDPALVARVRAKFPTAALATLSCAGPWAELGAAPVTLCAFVVPADLD